MLLLEPLAPKIRIAILDTTSSQARDTIPLAHNTNSFNMHDPEIKATHDRSEILT